MKDYNKLSNLLYLPQHGVKLVDLLTVNGVSGKYEWS